ncbi:carbon-nitrogen hydrolase [Trametes meyenii]|nr:carbon-nitrogen hydrolase [Trametes meyenii]
MRIAVIQFAPKIGKVQENIQKAQSLCERLRPNTVDLVCLPEMIFTGYVFPDAAAISPYLEEPRTGPTSRFCAELSARLRCYVVAGYPERLPPAEVDRAELADGRTIDRVGANAAALFGPDGAFVGEYRKTNLYDTDMTWAKPGTGFVTFHLPPPLNTVSLGICMDLNVHPPAFWESVEAGPYEVAEYCIAQRTNLLVLLNAWLDPGNDTEPGAVEDEDEEDGPDWQTINYWALRLRPLWARVAQESGSEHDEYASSDDPRDLVHSESSGGSTGGGHRKPGEELVVVICNRTGTENGVTFAGSSALFSLTRNSGRPRLLHAMRRRQEAAEIWTYPKTQGASAGGRGE